MTTSEEYPALCEACIKLGMASQPTQPHSALLLRGSIPAPAGAVTKQLFRCAECNTLWVRHIDKWGMEGAFRLTSNKWL